MLDVNDISIHVDIAAQSSAGTIFSNHPKRVTVLRWENASDEEAMLYLAQAALAEMEMMDCDTLLYDLGRIPEAEGSVADVNTRIHCLSSGLVSRWGVISRNPSASGEPADVKALLEEQGIPNVTGPDFKTVAEGLDALVENPEERLLTAPAPQDFYATYGGSIYSVPELRATVVRTAGNCAELQPVTKLFQDAIALSAKTQANLLIIDTSATRPITDMPRWEHVRDDVTIPVRNAGLFQNVIHVRSGDNLTAVDGPPIEPLIKSFGLPYFAFDLLSEAMAYAQVLQSE
jgi:hypothetical protein